jgi:hypothetical protein
VEKKQENKVNKETGKIIKIKNEDWEKKYEEKRKRTCRIERRKNNLSKKRKKGGKLLLSYHKPVPLITLFSKYSERVCLQEN